MTPFQRKRARVMLWMFCGGWALLMCGWFGGIFSRAFAWWNVAPFAVGWLLLLFSAPSVNGRLWGWIRRSYFGGSKD